MVIKQSDAYIQRCIELAKKGKGHVSPNPLVGCVIVKNGKVIAEGYHKQFGSHHAEVNAINAALAAAAAVAPVVIPYCINRDIENLL